MLATRNLFTESLTLLALLLSGAPLTAGTAGERFLQAGFEELEFEGERPRPPSMATVPAYDWTRAQSAEPYVVLDHPGEAYLAYGDEQGWNTTPWIDGVPTLVLRTEHAGAISGRLFYPKPDLSGFQVHRFRWSAVEELPAARERFGLAMEAHYARWIQRGLPGAAWFRHRWREARALRGETAPEDTNGAPRSAWMRSPGELDDTLDLFTGARAIAENLELDRVLAPAPGGEASVPIAGIAGIETRAIDWKPLIAGKSPELDPLAKLVPADQHAIFFPSFEAMQRVFEELDLSATPLLELGAESTSDERTLSRYQEQLGLAFSALSRLLGPAVIASVAVTGSDPYLPSGSDLAVLFECKQPAVLTGYLAMRRATAAKVPGAKSVEVDLGGLRVQGVATPDRRISTYTMELGPAIVVSNSLAQLERLAAVRAGAAALASAPEYVFFRDRYRRGEAGESALVVLSDAAIRRWCGPRARIGDSRRLRAAAAMSEIEAAHIAEIVRGTAPVGKSAADMRWPVTADFVWTAEGVLSPEYGRLGFLTPIAELSIDDVTPAERDAYARFRESYQRSWSAYFDPIAVRLAFSAERLAADVTVRPLQISSEYNELARWTRGAKLGAFAGDPHQGAFIHFALALALDGELGNLFSGMAGPFGRELGADPLSWVGNGVAVYAERDDFWKELLAAEGEDEFLQERIYHLPVALHVEVKDPLKLAAFLTALRAMADQAAPGIVQWGQATWNGQPYVKIDVSDEMDLPEGVSEAALCYVALPDALVVSLREDLIQSAIDRRKTRKAGGTVAGAGPWLGESAGLRFEGDALELGMRIFQSELGNARQRAAWAALPILNEWRRMFPEADPISLQERIWHQRLGASGDYVWDPEWMTMRSVRYGAPAAPLEGPALAETLADMGAIDFGLTFEDDGLRARAELTRSAKK